MSKTGTNKSHCKNVGDCTNFPMPAQVPLKTFKIPEDLCQALQNHLEENKSDNELCKSYIKCIKSFQEVRKIECLDYVTLFKMFLYIEDFQLQENVKKHKLYDYQLTQCMETVSITVPTLDQDDPFLSIGDTVIFKINANTSKKYRGTVKDINSKTVTVDFPPKSTYARKLTNKVVDIEFRASNWSLRCFHYALYIVNKYNLIDLLYPTLKSGDYLLQQECDLDWVHKSVADNWEQRKAVFNIMNSSAHPAPYILFGPPGTGKTTTLIEAICQILKQDSTKRILVCASSNTAADEVAKRLLNIISSKDVFRMYAASKNWQTINEEIKPSSNFVDDAPVFLPKELLLMKKVVVLTLVSCMRLVPLNLRSTHFSHIFIDEASQALEPETLIPFTLTKSLDVENNGTLCAQIVLAGDPFQLGPIVQSKYIQHLFEKSMLERLMECEPYQRSNGAYDPRYITKLIRNYRSSEPIISIPNRLFYNNELVCCNKSSADNVISNWTEVKNKTFPIIFFDVKGKEMRMNNRSVYNEKEIIVVLHYVAKLMRKCNDYKMEQKDIGIVTPFKEQQKMISNRLQEKYLGKVTVGTVETFQGQERDIIILTTVRTNTFTHNGHEHVGFLSNPKRFNVAVTRAKRLLIVIGHSSVLRTSKCWEELWKYCEENDACIPITESFFNNRNLQKKKKNLQKEPQFQEKTSLQMKKV